MKKKDSLDNIDIIIPSSNKKGTNKVSKPRKTSSNKETIIKEEEVVFSRVKKNEEKVEYSRSRSSYNRKKDKKLESLIEEINKPRKPLIEEEEILELEVSNKKNNIFNEDEEVLEIKEKKETKKEPKKVFDSQETMVLPNYKKEVKKLEKKVDNKPSYDSKVSKKVTPTKKKKKKYRVKKRAVALVVFILLVMIGSITAFVIYKGKQRRLENERIRKENYIKEVTSHFNEVVKSNKDATLYKKVNSNYQVYGTLYKDNTMSIEKEDIDENTKYFHNEDLDVYIGYSDVDPEKNEIVKDDRYKKYIPFNENIVTDDEYIIYHQDDKKYYKLSESKEYPIIIKMSDKYYFEYQDELVYVMKDDVKETKKATNTKLTPVSSVPVLNYHHIYDPKEMTCNQSICMTTTRYREHIKWFKDNNILDLTMKEFDMFMNNQVRLPKSVLVTHDDGWLRQNAIKIVDEEKFHATYFLVTSWYLPIESQYMEYHSHSHNMHNQGECKNGQGGGIQCLAESKIQADLKKSREILNDTTYFCYPFYEYNDYSISQLKKAGFTMAFVGGQRAAKPSDNHYKIPRYVIYSWTTTNNLKQYFK